MKLKDLINKYESFLSEDKNYVKGMDMEGALNSKEDLYNLLELWHKISGAKNIGLKNNITTTIYIKLGSKTYWINSDSNKDGVEMFLENRGNDWRIVNENKSGAVTNQVSGEKIKGFQMYKLQH